MKSVRLKVLAWTCLLALVLGAAGAAWADTIITITGTLDPITIDVQVSPSRIDFYLPTGETEASQQITISNRSPIPLWVRVVSLRGSQWGLVPADENLESGKYLTNGGQRLSLTDANRGALLMLDQHSNSPGWAVPPSYDRIRFVPNNIGEADARCVVDSGGIVHGLTWGAFTDVYTVGEIREAPDGGSADAPLTLILRADIRRLNTKATNWELTLRFDLPV
jgi:hypothetical protein